MNQDDFLMVVSKALEVDRDKINMKLKIGDLEEWDSLGHLTILSSLDGITGGKASEINNFGALESLQQIWIALNDAGLTK
jgi:hypothetical protein